MTGQPVIWALTDDRPGNAAQTLGVAEALGHEFTIKALRYTPLAKLHSSLQGASLIGLTPESRMILAAPWPNLVIAAGRRTAPAARWIKRRAGGRTHLVHIMNPGRSGAAEFDLIVLPRHDGGDADAANVLRITGAPHRLTAERLASARDAWAARLAPLPRPWVAVLAGGATHSRPFPAHLAAALGRSARDLAGTGTVLLATSRRTGVTAEAALLETIGEPCSAFQWSKGGDNPYFGFLALADAVVVTGDSVSMCSEACATPGPVYIYAPEGMAVPKHERLHRELYDLGLARPLPAGGARFETWRHAPLNAAADVKRAIERVLG